MRKKFIFCYFAHKKRQNSLHSSLIFFIMIKRLCTNSKYNFLFVFQALTAGSPWQRRACFALPFTMRIFLALLRVTRLGGGSPTSFTHIVLQVCRYFIANYTNKTREKQKYVNNRKRKRRQ